ncbi:MFS transporter [Pseudonocardia sp. 73-21]|uniref:MFS transporter n=1 Tax=Pseudonocardia sp. 73-21 TaxID=1895809 RepID=UPI000966ED27|nr:MFS transporter [Pseudonocardia sp. 73-21]OJY47835.1 MAG: hypothetical protein BGP03_05840 [Pseudonocardia sp. 73-21]
MGAALEYYDFVVYLYVATLIGQAFFPADLSPTMRLVQTLGIYSIGLLIRPVAGILIARVADRVGRKRMFILTVAVMSVATLLIGLLPTYDHIGWPAPVLLLLLRVAQGCAVGGELPAAAVFVTEHARPDGVARAGAFQQMTAYSGFLLGAGVAFVAGLVATHLTPDLPSLAWRLPFLVGGLLGVVSSTSGAGSTRRPRSYARPSRRGGVRLRRFVRCSADTAGRSCSRSCSSSR